MKSHHTPGPWRVGQFYDRGPGDAHLAVYDNFHQQKLAVIEKWLGDATPESEANAKLIAAAPELLAALKGLRDSAARIAEHFDVDGPGTCGTAPIWGFLQDAQEAIVKAEGGQ